MYQDRDTFDIIQGHVANNQPLWQSLFSWVKVGEDNKLIYYTSALFSYWTVGCVTKTLRLPKPLQQWPRKLLGIDKEVLFYQNPVSVGWIMNSNEWDVERNDNFPTSTSKL